jgi:SPP1 gp7 family putative phage head morphogenesis protein
MFQTPIKNDTSDYESPYYFPSQNSFFNPDDIAQKFTLDKYDEMKLDDQVKAALYLKKMTVIGSGGEVVPPEKEELTDLDKRITEFVDFNINDYLIGSFSKFLYKDMSAYDYGFSITEKLFGIIEHSQWKGMHGIQQLKTRPPHTFDQGFITDQHGNLVKIIQDAKNGKIELDPRKFIIYTYNSDFDGNFYGTPDLRATYNAWFRKQQINKFWAIALERAALSPLMAFVERGVGTTEQNKVNDWLKNMQLKSTAVFKKGTEIESLEMKSKGLDKAYGEAISYHDKAINRSILLPDQLGFSDTKFGSRASSDTQLDVFFNVIRFLREEQEEVVIFEQYIKPLVDANFGKQEDYPKYKFNTITEDDKQKALELVIKAVKDGVIVKDEVLETFVREKLELPPKEEVEEEDTEDDNDTEDNDRLEQPERKEKPEVDDKEVLDKIDNTEFAEKKKRVDISLHRKPNAHEEKMEFNEVVNELEVLENKALDKSIDVMEDITETLITGVINKKIIENKDMVAINNLDIPGFGKLRSVFHDASLASVAAGFKRGSTAISNARKEFAEGQNFGLNKSETIEWLKKNSIAVTGKVKHDVEDAAKRILYQALKDGKTTKETVFELERMMQNFLEGSVTAKASDKAWVLENIVRTGTNTAYNMGLQQSYEATTFVERYQVSAILDSRTSDICTSLDGTVYAKDDPEFTFPPYHFQCRTIIVPIVTDEPSELTPGGGVRQQTTIRKDKGFSKVGEI